MTARSAVSNRIKNPEVAAVFKGYPKDMREKLLFLRRLIFGTASATEGVGELEETLKWGEPSYLTPDTKSGSTVRIDWKEKKDGSVRIEQNILCDRENHKAMVIGKSGAVLKKIGVTARSEMAEVLGRKVHLFLFAKVSRDWPNKPHHYREIGLDFVE